MCMIFLPNPKPVLSCAEGSRIGNRSTELTTKSKISSLSPHSSLLTPRQSLDHLGRPIEDLGGDRDVELLSRFEVNDQVELYWPLHGQVRRLGAL